MCGIVGIFGEKSRDPQVIRAMSGALSHRGPDDEGSWNDRDAAIAFGHRRLAVVDLSPAGHQPMELADGRFILNFNGEIYNFEELREELESAGQVPSSGWRGHSDTEVFLQAISAWGLEQSLGKASGMFAFAVWDRAERLLTLVRDRFGEKPLYYGWAGKDFVFGSELKALRAHPSFDNPISREALALFATRTHVPAPLSIYERTFKLPPGCLLEIDESGARAPRAQPVDELAGGAGVRLRQYWSYRDVVERGLAEPIDDEAEALDRLDQALETSIRGQSFADVPVGAFLSGGIDSSTITAIYQRHASLPVRTFSIGFEESGFNEAEHAKAVARHLGTVHHEHYVTASEARDVIPLLSTIYDEPFADSSQIPTYLVSRFARREVTVALTGDGGDELFGGYNRHVHGPRLWRQIERVPKPLRALAAGPLSRLPTPFWSVAGKLVPGPERPNLTRNIPKALRTAASVSSLEEVYRSFREEWPANRSPVIGAGAASLPFDLNLCSPAPDAMRMMYCDAVSYLPDDILCKVDRASMAVSLETRVPFLDHRVAELAARIPFAMKFGPGGGKLILRKLLARHVPRHLVDRPKAGFAVPIGEWIKGPLRDWAEDLLDSRSLKADGWFDADLVAGRWKSHLNGREDAAGALWSVLMFQAWLREQKMPSAAAA